MRRLTARELITVMLDGEWASWDSPVTRQGVGADYLAELESAAAKSGTDESVLTGEGRIGGQRIAVIVGEFRFLGGSIGIDAARRIVAAVERATAERLPILAAPVSGGTRMQEGVSAFMQMVAITQAITAHKDAGLPYLVYLRHPTTGGVFASWGSLGHVTLVEPNALVGFLGPKVYEALEGAPFPADVQTGENLFAHGIVDAVVRPGDLRTTVARILRVALAGGGSSRTCVVPAARDTTPPKTTAWASITASRRADRPGLRTFMRHAATDVTWLSGTGVGERRGASRIALCRFGEHAAVVAAVDRCAQSRGEALDPGALRQLRRGMRLAGSLHLPLVTVIDTPGAALSREAEEGGLAGEIARSIADLLVLEVPTLAVLLGQGTGGGALALLPADRVIVAQHGWLAPLAPEGASAIRFGDTDHAARMAEQQRVSSADLLADGVADEVVAELPDAAVETHAFCRRLGAAVERHLQSIVPADIETRLAARRRRYGAGVGFRR